MIWKTHVAIGLAVALFFSAHVNKPLIFVPIVILASFFPDIDSGFSYIGRNPIFKPVQWTTSHRGIIHSYTFCIALSLLIALFYPILALPFFLGYSFHLFADSFTQQGIKPFWPLKTVSKGTVTTGGKVDKTIFYIFVFIDCILLGTIFYSLL
jgi:membrane-bound metal-dependent hydrolase YbcI (DUF457 family)